MGGEKLCHIEATDRSSLADLRAELKNAIGLKHPRFDIVLPGGAVLDTILSQDPTALVGTWRT